MSCNKGVWLPKEVIQDKTLTWTKKVLIMEITQLSELEKGCVASNAHFADLLGITSQGVSKALNELDKDGHITINNAQTKRNFGRTITINHRKSAINHRKSAINHSVESKETNTKTNTENKDIVETEVIDDTFILVEEIVSHLNSVTGSKYKHTSRKTRSLIKSRMDEGFTADDFRHVHLVKFAQWGRDAKMATYLRPETLYGTKFESYLNEKLNDSQKAKIIGNASGLSALEQLEAMGMAS